MVEVIITDSAQEQRRLLLQYIYITFGKRLAQKVYDELEHYHLLLAANPHMGAIEPLLADYPEGYRSLVVHPHTKLIYYIDEEKERLYITDLWDVRREPNSLASKISNLPIPK